MIGEKNNKVAISLTTEGGTSRVEKLTAVSSEVTLHLPD